MRHECDDCDFCTFSRGSLRGHRTNIHKTDEFECDICKIQFPRKAHLNRHNELQHSEQSTFWIVLWRVFLLNLDPTFSCVECGKTFQRKDKMQRHRVTHQQDRIECELEGCSHSFPPNRVNKLINHFWLCSNFVWERQFKTAHEILFVEISRTKANKASFKQ